MFWIIAIIAGLPYALIQIFSVYCLIKDIKALIVCTEIVYAQVTSVDHETRRHEDSKTNKVEYIDYYDVTFKYEYNGKEYTTHKSYKEHTVYSKGDTISLKINPRNPKESWMREEFKTIVILILALPVYAFIDFLAYTMIDYM